VQNRIRFVVETLEAMGKAAGTNSKIGIKISPAMPFNDIKDDNPIETYTELTKAISPMGLAYLHVLKTPPIPNIFDIIRPHYKGTFLVCGAFTKETGNAMLASGGYPWTVIRVVDRKAYLSALDRASIEMDIHPFTTFIVRRVEWRLERHDLTFPAPMESSVFGRDIVLFYGQDGEAVVRCLIAGEALDTHFHGDGKDRLEVFRANRQPIEQEIRRRFLAGDTELDGSVLIRAGDLP
jgi:hypothetical protein